MGEAASVSVQVAGNSAGVTPPVLGSTVTFTYSPVLILACGDVVGGTTSIMNLVVTASFATPVTGLVVGDFVVLGATPTALTPASASPGPEHTYHLAVQLDGVRDVEVSLAEGAGAVDPAPQAASLVFQFAPHVTLQWNNGLSDGSATSLTSVVLLIEFQSAVSGFVATDVTLGGATAGSLAQTGTTTYELPVSLGPSTVVSAALPGASGSIEPPNMPSSQLSLEYVPGHRVRG